MQLKILCNRRISLAKAVLISSPYFRLELSVLTSTRLLLITSKFHLTYLVTSKLFLPWLFSHQGRSLLSTLLAGTTRPASLMKASYCYEPEKLLLTCVCVCSLWLRWITELIWGYLWKVPAIISSRFSVVCWLAAVQSHAIGATLIRPHTREKPWMKESTWERSSSTNRRCV